MQVSVGATEARGPGIGLHTPGRISVRGLFIITSGT